MFSSAHSCSDKEMAVGQFMALETPPHHHLLKGWICLPRFPRSPVPPGRDIPWPYLCHLLQAPQHEPVVADGGLQEFGHQAEADVQRQLLFEGQALGVEESPVIWGESTEGSVRRVLR